MSTTKTGRNDPCPCGSGKKYKRCCGSRPTPAELALKMRQLQEGANRERHLLEERGIYIDLVRPADFEGARVYALGNRIYHRVRCTATFHEFLLHMLRRELGTEWWEENASKPEPERHHVFRAFAQFEKWKERSISTAESGPGGIYGALPDGWSWGLMSLAFDVALLIHAAGGVGEDLLQRLRSVDHYQGARYEIAVASLFARIGCKVEFIPNVKTDKKHPEFYATLEPSGERVAVEAKSKGRKGVLHQPGEATEDGLTKTRVVRLINEAIQQNPGDAPFIIFVDINQPLDLTASPEAEMRRLMEATSDLRTPKPDEPDEFSLLCLTNYSGHFVAEAAMPQCFATFVLPTIARRPLEGSLLFERLQSAVNAYGSIPLLTPGGIVR